MWGQRGGGDGIGGGTSLPPFLALRSNFLFGHRLGPLVLFNFCRFTSFEVSGDFRCAKTQRARSGHPAMTMIGSAMNAVSLEYQSTWHQWIQSDLMLHHQIPVRLATRAHASDRARLNVESQRQQPMQDKQRHPRHSCRDASLVSLAPLPRDQIYPSFCHVHMVSSY